MATTKTYPDIDIQQLNENSVMLKTILCTSYNNQYYTCSIMKLYTEVNNRMEDIEKNFRSNANALLKTAEESISKNNKIWQQL